MSLKRNNWLVLLLAVLTVVALFAGNFIIPGWDIGGLLRYLIAFGIGLLFLKKDGVRLFDALPYNVGAKPCMWLLAVATVPLLTPLCSLLSELGAVMISKDIFNGGIGTKTQTLAQVLFTMAVLPAVFEEMFFRGFFYSGFKRAGGIRLSLILSSILFGLFHMNVQQILYASVCGVFIALFRELSGSMWPGMLFHLLNNTWAVICSRMMETQPADHWVNKLPSAYFSLRKDAVHTLVTIGAAIVCTGILIVLFALVAKRYGRLEEYKSFFKPAAKETGAEAALEQRTETRQRIVTFPLILGILIFLGVSVVVLFT